MSIDTVVRQNILCVQGKQALTNYWIFKVKDEAGGLYGRKGREIFDHRVQEGFWSLKEFSEDGKPESNVNLLEKGDYAVFYLVHRDGNRFLGTAKLDSSYTKLTDEQAKTIVHPDYIDSDQGVFLKEVNRWVKPLPVDNLCGKASFVRSSGKFGFFFQGSVKKMKHLGDYEAIIREYHIVN
jgi:hypothetical protein